MSQSDNKGSKYSDVGIDIKKIRSIQKSIGQDISKTNRFLKIGTVISGYGHYAGLVEVNKNIVAIHTDGVGSKILVAQLMDKYDTIGIDCIAMNVNDIVCIGATPLGYLSYIALQKTNNYLIKEITKGLIKGAKLSNVAIVGGETAILPDIITGKKENHNFDLAGMIFGIVKEKNKLIMGNRIKNGDQIIGIKSSGLHSNGYTLARKVLLSKYEINDKPQYLKSKLGDELIKPTRIYSRLILMLIKEFGNKIHGLAHITGGAFTKLGRLNSNVNFILDNMPKAEGVFKQIMIDGNVSIEEMYRTFNMGIGFCVISSKKDSIDIINYIKKEKMNSEIIGVVNSNGNGETLIKSKYTNNKLTKF